MNTDRVDAVKEAVQKVAKAQASYERAKKRVTEKADALREAEEALDALIGGGDGDH